MDSAIKVTDVAIFFATLLGPIFAVQAQGWLDSRREERRRHLEVFHCLMRTRAVPLSVEHVNALNAVPLEFQGDRKAIKSVRSAWRIYINHFSKDTSAPGWQGRRLELLTALLQRMGESLKYELDAVEIERDAYAPNAHEQAAAENDSIRKGLAAILRGEGTLPMTIDRLPHDEEMRQRLLGVLQKLDGFLTPQIEKNEGNKSSS